MEQRSRKSQFNDFALKKREELHIGGQKECGILTRSPEVLLIKVDTGIEVRNLVAET